MSTRATISVIDENDHFDIYRHHDGYPEGPHGVVNDIGKAMYRAWPEPRFEAGDMAAAIVSVMKTKSGSIYLTRDATRHIDRDFHYEISQINRSIRIVIKDFSSNAPLPIQRFAGRVEDALRHYNGNDMRAGHSSIK